AVSHSGVSLRDAIATANVDAVVGVSDTITFDPSLNGSTITLSQGQLELTYGSGTTTLDGGGQIAISGDNSSRVFQVEGSRQAVLTGLTIENGYAVLNATVINAGGGIFNHGGTVSVIDCTITG